MGFLPYTVRAVKGCWVAGFATLWAIGSRRRRRRRRRSSSSRGNFHSYWCTKRLEARAETTGPGPAAGDVMAVGDDQGAIWLYRPAGAFSGRGEKGGS